MISTQVPSSADAGLMVMLAGVVLTLAGGIVAGHVAHRWLFYNVPAIGERLPPDAGAWLGLISSLLLLLS